LFLSWFSPITRYAYSRLLSHCGSAMCHTSPA
jgi:hypothetical protein